MTSIETATPVALALAAVQAVIGAELAATELLDELLHAYFADNSGDEDRAPLEEALCILFETGVCGWFDDPDQAT